MTMRQLVDELISAQYAIDAFCSVGNATAAQGALLRRTRAEVKLAEMIEELRAAGETVLNTWPFIHADILSRTGAFREAYICPACGEDRPNHAGSCAASVLRAALIACEEEDE